MIRNKREFYGALPADFDGEFHWDFLDGAFGPTIRPMDFDAVVERYGHYLIFETKRDAQEIPDGQLRTFSNLFLPPRHFAIVLCEKHPDRICHWTVWTKKGQRHYTGDAMALHEWCAKWYRWASRSGWVQQS